jgi:hypothetical protein
VTQVLEKIMPNYFDYESIQLNLFSWGYIFLSNKWMHIIVLSMEEDLVTSMIFTYYHCIPHFKQTVNKCQNKSHRLFGHKKANTILYIA